MDHCQPQPHVAHIPLHRGEYHHGAPHHTMAAPPHAAHIPLHRGEYHQGAPHHTMAAPNYALKNPCMQDCVRKGMSEPGANEAEVHEMCLAHCGLLHGFGATRPGATMLPCMEVCKSRAMCEPGANEAEVHEMCLAHCGLLHGFGATRPGATMGVHRGAPHLTRSAPGAGQFQLQEPVEVDPAYVHCMEKCSAENPNHDEEATLLNCTTKCAGEQHTAPHLTRSSAPTPVQLPGMPEDSILQKIPGWLIPTFLVLVAKLKETSLGRWILEHIFGPLLEILGDIIVFIVFIKAVISGEGIAPM